MAYYLDAFLEEISHAAVSSGGPPCKKHLDACIDCDGAGSVLRGRLSRHSSLITVLSLMNAVTLIEGL